MIKLDISQVLVTVYCTDCPTFARTTFTADAGRVQAEIHEANVHPESRKIRNQNAKNAKAAEARRADLTA